MKKRSRDNTTPAATRKAGASTRRAGASGEFARTRARLDKKRAKRRQKVLWAHYWLLCPKCGGDMFVNRTLGIHFEVCRDCHGIALDGDELALLITHLDPVKALRAILKKSRKPDTTEI